MSIFEFIDCPEDSLPVHGTQIEQLFGITENPLIPCTNCLCQYCINNVEGKVMPGEMKQPCFNCDYCRIYDGDSRFTVMIQENCEDFLISDYASKMKRKKIHIVERKETV